MLTQYNLKMPHAVYGGENAMDNITAIIQARGAKKVAMFTDKGIEAAGLFALPEQDAQGCLDELQQSVPEAKIVGYVTEKQEFSIYLE